MQVLLELPLVLHRHIEGQHDRHSDADMAALERIELGVCLLIQCQVVRTESRRRGIGLVDGVLAGGDQLVRGGWLKPIAGRPRGAILADLSGKRALLLATSTIGVGVGQFDLRQGPCAGFDTHHGADLDVSCAVLDVGLEENRIRRRGWNRLGRGGCARLLGAGPCRIARRSCASGQRRCQQDRCSAAVEPAHSPARHQ